MANVFLQHIPVRLNAISDIPSQELFYILKCSLLGFHKLYKYIGYFEVKEDMICIDAEGKVRVWMSSDLS